ncbi:nitroreductase family protein [Brevundimonas sp. TSRC1-1]|uniref:nitroreductase family protein n=1 Tax=Brevundimonas sp. TSRC1-1 TaxID=2804562 RepID=UPI003CF3F5D3
MDARDAIRGRRAVRLYRDVPLGRDLIQGVVEDAAWAPSGMNQQPWRFFVIEGRERLARYSASLWRGLQSILISVKVIVGQTTMIPPMKGVFHVP